MGYCSRKLAGSRNVELTASAEHVHSLAQQPLVQVFGFQSVVLVQTKQPDLQFFQNLLGEGLAQGFLFIGDGLVVGGGDFFVVVEEDAVDRQPSGFAGVDQFFVFELGVDRFQHPFKKQSGPPAAGRSLPAAHPAAWCRGYGL